TRWQAEDLHGEISLSVGETRFWHPVSNSPLHFEFNDTYWTYGAAGHLSSVYTLAGMHNEWTAGVRVAYTDAKRRGEQPVFVPPFPRRKIHADQNATQWEGWLSNRMELTDQQHLVAGGLLTYATRRQIDHAV